RATIARIHVHCHEPNAALPARERRLQPPAHGTIMAQSPRVITMEHITCDIADHIATVTLHSLTMPPAFFAECERLFGQLAADDDLRAVILCAAGKAFSYGLDL